jgi:hypothetical protein
VIAVVALVGSVIMFMGVDKNRGTERGRQAFAAEIQQSYAKTSPSVRVYIEGRTLVIENRGETDESIDAAAQQFHEVLAKNGRNAKAWVLGFEAIKLTNGGHEQRLAPADPP